MKLFQKFIVFSLYFTVCIVCISCKNAKDTDTYAFQSYENVPFKLMTYTLKNGLKLYMVPRKDEPNIEARIIVKAGAINDPIETKGLAHYLEHLMFFGTDSIGAYNFEKEEPILTKIEDLFETYRKEKNPAKKEEIYTQIDSLSYLASQYASSTPKIRELALEMGAFYDNAYTRADFSGYMNKIPSNQLDKWIKLQYERFRNPVFRNFATALDAVYEELNSYYNNGYQLTKIKLFENTFPNGEFYRDPLGTPEDLTNPSLRETKNFFNKYYVPNNMAIILVGDFNLDHATSIIEDSFGQLESKEIPKTKTNNLPLLKKDKELSISTPQGESIAMCFIGPQANSKDAYLAEFAEMLFYNGNYDLASLGESKTKSAWINTRPMFFRDFIAHYIEVGAKDTSVQELKDIILKDVNRLKTGEYPEWLLSATANDLNKRFTNDLRYNGNIVDILSEIFGHNKSIEDFFNKQEKFKSITKEDLKNFANKYYNHYSIVYNKKGESSFKRVEKPKLSSLSNVNENKESVFAKKLRAIEVEPINPMLVDFREEIKKTTLDNGAQIAYVQNNTDNLFSLKIALDNTKSPKLLQLAKDYLNYANSKNYTQDEFKSEMYKLGCSFNLNSSINESELTIDGLSINLESALKLVINHLSNLEVDEQAMESVKESKLDVLNREKNSQGNALNRIVNYVKYEPETFQNHILSIKDIKQATAQQITSVLNKLFESNPDYYLYDSRSNDETVNLFNKTLVVKNSVNNTKQIPIQKRKLDKNSVYLYDIKGTQAFVSIITNLNENNKEEKYLHNVFRNYSSTIIHDEIRELRGLAYSAYTGFQDNISVQPQTFFSRMHVPIEKYSEAISVNYEILKDLPMKESLFEKKKDGLVEVWNSERFINHLLLKLYEDSKLQGFETDYRRQYVEDLPKMSFEDFQSFYRNSIQNNKFSLIIVGDLSQINQEYLKKYGEITVLTKEDLFEE